MSFKMVVMDLDDTLLRNDLSLSERNKSVIKEAQERGIKIVLASGRPTFAMRNLALELGMDQYESYLISYNGAVITDFKNDISIFEQTISKESAHILYDLSKLHNVFIHTYVNDEIVTTHSNEYTDIEAKITGMNVNLVQDFKNSVKNNVIKVLMLEEPSYLKKVEQSLKASLSDTLNVTISKPFFLEFMDKGIDKGSSIERIISKLGIKREEVMAIGDSYNDLGMIKFAGMGVCMANAPDDIKSQSDYITASNMEDGVAQVIEKFVLNIN